MFFTAIHQMMTESVDLTIVIRKTKRTTDRFHIAQIERTQGRGPEPHRAADCHGKGTPQELDTGFLQAVTRPIQKTCG